MDTLSIANLATNLAANALPARVGTAVLKKALDIQLRMRLR